MVAEAMLCMNAYIYNVLGLPAFVTFFEFGFLIPPLFIYSTLYAFVTTYTMITTHAYLPVVDGCGKDGN